MPQAAIAAAIAIGVSLASAAISYALTPTQELVGDRLEDLNAPKSNYGLPIPKPFGTVRLNGNLIWANKIIEISQKKKRGKGGGKSQTTEYEYYGDFATLHFQGPAVGVRKIWLNSKLVYDVSAEASAETQANSIAWAAKYLSIYLGTDNQSPDGLIQASLGADNTPAYRGRGYLVFKRLPLKDFGNRFPQVSLEVVTHGSVGSPSLVPLSEILEYLCLSAGLSESQIDTSLIALEEIEVRGFTVDRTKVPKQILEQLQQAFFFHFVESEGKIKFLPYEIPSVAGIPKSHLAAHEYGGQRPEDYEQDRTADLELPQEIALTYSDLYLNYQSSVVRAKRVGYDTGENNPQVQFPIVYARHEAQKVVEQLLYLTWLRRREFKFSLPPKYLFLEPADVVTIPLNTGSQEVQLTKVTLGANFVLECEGIAYSNTTITRVSTPETVTPPTPIPVTAAGEVDLDVLDIPLVKDSDFDNGLYLAADATRWQGASVYVSRNAGESWQFAKNLTLPSTKGICNTVLGSSAGATVSVTITDGELESVLAKDLDYGDNTALVGSEIIRFQTATLTATNTYTLSNLVRGVRGTEAYIATHGVEERFVLLSDYLERVEGLTSDLGTALQFKAISGDQSLEDVDAVTITPVGNSLKPYSVVNPTATKDLTGKITISWQRRDRKAGEATIYTNLPLSETSESYEVDIMDGATAIRTLVSATPSVAYSVADQTTDFGGLQTTVTVRIYQLSSLVGRGTVKEAVLTPTILAATPEITGFTPTGASVGDTVTVYGTGLTGTTAASIGGTPVSGLTVVNDGELTFTLPAGASTGKLSITTPGGTVESPTGFAVTTGASVTINYERVRFFL